jgi:hypothetical protein
MAILIWMMSPSVKGYVKNDIQTFPLSEYEAHYSVNWYGLYAGESIHRLVKQASGQYHYEARTEPKIRFLPYHYVESSDFTWQSGEILPQNYYYNIREGKRHKKGNVLFDWKSNKIRNPQTSTPWETAMPFGIQDKLTQTLSLRQALIQGKTNINYTVAEDDKLKNYTFIILGEERLTTKLGVLDTVKVEHISRKGHRTTMWFAKSLDYLPVKMTQQRKGKQVASGEILTFTPFNKS